MLRYAKRKSQSKSRLVASYAHCVSIKLLFVIGLGSERNVITVKVALDAMYGSELRRVLQHSQRPERMTQGSNRRSDALSYHQKSV